MENRTVLITGASKRIGREISAYKAENGWNIVIHYNSSEKEALELAEALPVRTLAVKADLTKHEEICSIFKKANESFGHIDCLINNASSFVHDNAETATLESWDTNIKTNLYAPFFLMQKFAEQLPSGKKGNIINIIDQKVFNPSPEYTSYTVSKAGLKLLTETMAVSLAPNIKVNGIAPGFVMPYKDSKTFEELYKKAPLQIKTSAEEICETIGYILHTPSMTGNIIKLDSGQSLGWKHS